MLGPTRKVSSSGNCSATSKDDDYTVDQMTDAAEYLEQMKYFAEIRPSFPFDLGKVKLEGTEHFYRVVRAGGSGREGGDVDK